MTYSRVGLQNPKTDGAHRRDSKDWILAYMALEWRHSGPMELLDWIRLRAILSSLWSTPTDSGNN
jgi:hypothetical protein